MRSEIESLLHRVNSLNKDEQAEAILQVALLLEKNSLRADNNDFYRVVLPDYLLTASLTTLEEEELIQAIAALLYSPKMTSSLLWALGKTSSIMAFTALLSWLDRQNTVEEEAAWQALIALDNFFTLDENGKVNPTIARIVHAENGAAILQRLVEKGTPKLQALAEKLLLRVGKSDDT